MIIQSKNRVLVIVLIFGILMLHCSGENHRASEWMAYLSGEEEGLQLKRHFRDDGSLVKEYTFKEFEGELVNHGYERVYYDSGELKFSLNYHLGKRIGSMEYYYKSGRVKEYWFYNPAGIALYNIRFNEHGDIVYEKGANQRGPQIVEMEQMSDSILVRVYSASIPGYDKKVYFVNPDGIAFDSVIWSERVFDEFAFKLSPQGFYGIKVHYANWDTSFIDSTSVYLDYE